MNKIKLNKNYILTFLLIFFLTVGTIFLIGAKENDYGQNPLKSQPADISQKLVLGKDFVMSQEEEEKQLKKEEELIKEKKEKIKSEPLRGEDRVEEAAKIKDEKEVGGEDSESKNHTKDNSESSSGSSDSNHDSSSAIDNDDPKDGTDPAKRPKITTSIKNHEKVKGNLYRFTLETIDYKGNWLSGFHTNVFVNGKRVYPEERGKIVEYRLDDKDLVNGENTIDIVGKDSEGNIKKLRYKINVNLNEEKVLAGYVTVTARADSIGLGRLFSSKVKMYKDESPAFVVKRAFEENGFEFVHVKNTKYGLYMKGIKRAGLKNGWHFPPAIEEKLKAFYGGDEVTFKKLTKVGKLDTLKEFDYKGTSGWLFYSNGKMANYGLSAFPLSPGDRISVVFSLDFGKEYRGYTGEGKWDGINLPID